MSTSQSFEEPRFVFVGGLHRSGTSLMAELLSRSPRATGLIDTGNMEDEGHYLHDVVPSAYEYGGPGRFAFDERVHLGPSDTPDVDRRRLLDAWHHHWATPAAAIKVEKSPQNLVQTRWLQSVMPNARFVIVTRHPATVALATMKWTRRGPRVLANLRPTASMQSLVDHWRHAHRLFELDRPHLDHVEVVRFEDLIDPASDLVPDLWARLGLDDPPDVPARRPGGTDYDRQWQNWLAGRAGQRAQSTWLDDAEADIAAWGYSFDDRLV